MSEIPPWLRNAHLVGETEPSDRGWVLLAVLGVAIAWGILMIAASYL